MQLFNVSSICIESVRLIIILLLTVVLWLHDRLLQALTLACVRSIGSSPSQPAFPDVCVLLTCRGVPDHSGTG